LKKRTKKLFLRQANHCRNARQIAKSFCFFFQKEALSF